MKRRDNDMNKYKITNITDLNNQPRTDGLYPNRIGSIVEVVNLDNDTLNTGNCLVMAYLQDNKGNNKEGLLVTSMIQSAIIDINKNKLKIYTLNSVYYLERCE